MNLAKQSEVMMTPVDRLEIHPENPRKGNIKAIRESIEHNGFYGVIVAQKSTNRILAGNHRYLAAKEEGAEEVPVVFVDCDDKQALKILLADNRTNDLASYDTQKLNEILKSIEQDLEGTGYTVNNIFTEKEMEGFKEIEIDPTEKMNCVCEKCGNVH